MRGDNRVVLVTGGAHGIGRDLAYGLQSRGWQVAVLDVDEAAGSALEADDILYIEGDVAEEAEVADAIAVVVNEYGALDALINNAGLSDPHSGPLETLDLESWYEYIDVNLTGPYLLCKHALPHLRASRGSVINIASTRALQSAPHTEAYAASKGGLVALTHALAISAGPEVRVNCISPGWIDTHGGLSELDHTQHPVGRAGTAADVTALAAFLLSDEAGFITGQNYVIDGGMTRKMTYLE